MLDTFRFLFHWEKSLSIWKCAVDTRQCVTATDTLFHKFILMNRTPGSFFRILWKCWVYGISYLQKVITKERNSRQERTAILKKGAVIRIMQEKPASAHNGLVISSGLLTLRIMSVVNVWAFCPHLEKTKFIVNELWIIPYNCEKWKKTRWDTAISPRAVDNMTRF